MDTEYTLKVFKSGNSLAVRLPKALGLSAGMRVALTKRDDGVIIGRLIDDQVDLADLFGSFSPGFMGEGRRAADEPVRDWADRDRAA